MERDKLRAEAGEVAMEEEAMEEVGRERGRERARRSWSVWFHALQEVGFGERVLILYVIY